MSIVLLPILLPVMTALLLVLLPDKFQRYLMIVCIAAVFVFSLFLLMGNYVGEQVTLLPSVFQMESGIAYLSFTLHPIGRIALFAFALALSLGLLFGLQNTSSTQQAISLVALAGASGIVLADNFLTFLFFWEVLTITSVLLIFMKKTQHAIAMAQRVLFMQLIGGLSLTVGIIMHYNATGSLTLAEPAAGLIFFIIGIGMKAAFLPFHVWVSWGYPAAPYTASVLLAALCTKVGVYGLARLLPPSEFLALMGAAMAIVAVMYALLQHNLRRLLSVHIVSQVGFMVASIGLGGQYGLDGAMLHLANHMMYKSLLFMCAGAVLFATGTEDLHDLHHPPEGQSGPPLWKAMPVVFAGVLIGSLAISGMPLFNGYVSKYLIKHAAHGVEPVEFILLAASVGTALSFMKFVWFGFISARAKVIRRPTTSMLTAIILLATACLFFGVYPQAIEGLLPNQTILHVYEWSAIIISLRLIGIALVIFVCIKSILIKGIHAPSWISTGLSFVGRFIGSAAAGMIFLFQSAALGLQTMMTTVVGFGYRVFFRVFQQVDYRPGEKGFFHFVNISNLDFDILLVLLIFGALAMWNLISTLHIQIIYTSPF